MTKFAAMLAHARTTAPLARIVLRLRGGMQIFVKTLTGKTITLDVGRPPHLTCPAPVPRSSPRCACTHSPRTPTRPDRDHLQEGHRQGDARVASTPPVPNVTTAHTNRRRGAQILAHACSHTHAAFTCPPRPNCDPHAAINTLLTNRQPSPTTQPPPPPHQLGLYFHLRGRQRSRRSRSSTTRQPGRSTTPTTTSASRTSRSRATSRASSGS